MLGAMDVIETFDHEDGEGQPAVSERAGVHMAHFRLSMTQLNGKGLSIGWFMREAADRHWWALADGVGLTPARLRDSEGRRVIPAVLEVRVSGQFQSFNEDDEAVLRLCDIPSAANGWRSLSTLDAGAGATARVEIATDFLRRKARSNLELEPTEPVLPDAEAGPAAARTRELRQEGRALRLDAIEKAPHHSVPVCPETHLNGVGLMCFAAMGEGLAQAERKALAGPLGTLPLTSRAQSHFANVDAGDWLDFTSEVDPVTATADPSLRVRTWARRRSDGRVVAASTSCWGVY
ncbi:hypothetical protein [Litorisediminicola beolgyonensis]|uniref:MaoC like domain protein n=1 Tax=Litorisediminicola beolgyonensis TaxID=1173614 RepID=A0ABW3ZEC7_9RHOB